MRAPWNLFIVLGLILAVGGLPSYGQSPAPAAIDIREWEVPWPATRPRDPFVDNGGAVWFVGQAGDYIARLAPRSGKMTKIDLDPGTGPHNLVVGADGRVWYAGNRQAHIGVHDPAAGTIEKIAMPDADARDPHTLVFDQGGDIWFTVQRGNFVGHLDTESRAVDLIPVPTRRARPYGIAVAPDGTVWVALFGTAKLASVDPATLQLTEHTLPRGQARPRRLDVTDDGRVWYVDFAGGFLGAFDPASGDTAEWQLPSGSGARPYGMAVDGDNRIWLVETGLFPNRFVGFDPRREAFFASTNIPSGGGAVRHMSYDAETDAVWFGTDANTVGRVVVN